MTSGLPLGVVRLNNAVAAQPRRAEAHQSFPVQPPIQQIHVGETEFGTRPPPNSSMILPRPSPQYMYSPQAHLISPHNARTLQQPIPDSQPRQNIDVFDIRDGNITEAEARKRLSSYVVVRMERSTDRHDIDDEGNPVPPTWEKASHMIQRDISQQETARKVRQLDKETGPVNDKKNELSSAIQRQLEHAWNKLEHVEADPRFVYTLAQLDWKLRRIESSRERHKKHSKRSRDKKRSKQHERLGPKEPSSRSKPKKERVSVTAYFKREPARNENCVSMLKAQQADGRAAGSLPLSEHLPMAMPAQPPVQRPARLNPMHSPLQTRQPLFEPQVQCRFPFSQPPNAAAVDHPHVNASYLLPPPRTPQPAPPLPVRIPPRPLPEISSSGPLLNATRNSIPRAVEEQNRRIRLNPPGMERQATLGSHHSGSSVTSFTSLSSEDSDGNLTPHSSVDYSPHHLHHHHHPHHHHEGQRGRSRYRQHRVGSESFGLEVARQQRPRDSADGFNGIPPPAPDPIKAASGADILRRTEQRAYRERMVDGHVMARSMTARDSSRQPRISQDPLEGWSTSFYRTARCSMSDEDMDRLGESLSRTSLADEPRSRQEPARDPAIHHEYTYREPPRRCRDGSEDGFLIPESNRNAWRRQDAQRYMTGRQRSDQDAWDLGSSAPLRYTKSQRRGADYTGYRR
ncbi:hypothetical protein V8C37DRAFT_579 [Trichoderma ceciliae]